jgi:hypothetical protein
VTLEFNRVVEQVYKLGNMLTKLDFDLSDKMGEAAKIFADSSDLTEVWERIKWVRQSDISGYRGAAPVDLPNAEAINGAFPAPVMPARATLIATDGGQIYPDEQAPVHYYLINIGVFVYHHGTSELPEQYTYPELKFHKSHVHDRYGRVIRNRTVDDRRTVQEMKTLAEECWKRKSEPYPMVALYDNRLMFLPGNDAYDSSEMMADYMRAMAQLHESGATLAGYIDAPKRSKRFIQLLFLMSIKNEQELRARRMEMSTTGQLEGLRDDVFFDAILEPGERSAIMVQNSPQNKEFRDKGANYEVAFFYLKVHSEFEKRIVRVDLPVWVARDKARVDVLHSLILDQCRLQGRNPYPYAITRADELARVTPTDQRQLDDMVKVQIRRVKPDLIGRTLTAKQRGKELARSRKRPHDMRVKDIIDER